MKSGFKPIILQKFMGVKAEWSQIFEGESGGIASGICVRACACVKSGCKNNMVQSSCCFLELIFILIRNCFLEIWIKIYPLYGGKKMNET